jgi:hypothetical protein
LRKNFLIPKEYPDSSKLYARKSSHTCFNHSYQNS